MEIVKEEKNTTGSYVSYKDNDKKKIKSLLALGHKPIFHPHYIVINGITFNGFAREEIDKMMEEVKGC